MSKEILAPENGDAKETLQIAKLKKSLARWWKEVKNLDSRISDDFHDIKYLPLLRWAAQGNIDISVLRRDVIKPDSDYRCGRLSQIFAEAGPVPNKSYKMWIVIDGTMYNTQKYFVIKRNERIWLVREGHSPSYPASFMIPEDTKAAGVIISSKDMSMDMRGWTNHQISSYMYWRTDGTAINSKIAHPSTLFSHENIKDRLPKLRNMNFSPSLQQIKKIKGEKDKTNSIKLDTTFSLDE